MYSIIQHLEHFFEYLYKKIIQNLYFYNLYIVWFFIKKKKHFFSYIFFQILSCFSRLTLRNFQLFHTLVIEKRSSQNDLNYNLTNNTQERREKVIINNVGTLNYVVVCIYVCMYACNICAVDALAGRNELVRRCADSPRLVALLGVATNLSPDSEATERHATAIPKQRRQRIRGRRQQQRQSECGHVVLAAPHGGQMFLIIGHRVKCCNLCVVAVITAAPKEKECSVKAISRRSTLYTVIMKCILHRVKPAEWRERRKRKGDSRVLAYCFFALGVTSARNRVVDAACCSPPKYYCLISTSQ